MRPATSWANVSRSTGAKSKLTRPDWMRETSSSSSTRRPSLRACWWTTSIWSTTACCSCAHSSALGWPRSRRLRMRRSIIWTKPDSAVSGLQRRIAGQQDHDGVRALAAHGRQDGHAVQVVEAQVGEHQVERLALHPLLRPRAALLDRDPVAVQFEDGLHGDQDALFVVDDE